MPSVTPKPFARLLLTGASGQLGTALRPVLRSLCTSLRLSDLKPCLNLLPSEEDHPANLASLPEMMSAVKGVDAIIHFGGISTEQAFEPILQANIVGLYNLYEAARSNKVGRIVFASSNHVTGFYERGRRIDPSAPHRPDGLYGVSKVYGEALARCYFDRFGIETVCLRLGTCSTEPTDIRSLSTWLSRPDLARLVTCSLLAHKVDHCIIYGVSANTESWWDNGPTNPTGFIPEDNAEIYRNLLTGEPKQIGSTNARADYYQGGNFVIAGME